MTDQASFMSGDRVKYIGPHDLGYGRIKVCDEGVYIDSNYNSNNRLYAIVSWDNLEISKRGHSGTSGCDEILRTLGRMAGSCWNVPIEDIKEISSSAGEFFEELDSILDEQDRYRETTNG